MGRTNAIILALGLVACLALSLIMRHAVGLTERSRAPESLVPAFDSALGSSIAGPSSYTEESIAGQTLGLLTLRAAPGIEPETLAATAGRLVWSRRGPAAGLVAVVVDCVPVSGNTRRFQIPAPGEPDQKPVLLAPSLPPADAGQSPPPAPDRR